jgi:hypothetical protein
MIYDGKLDTPLRDIYPREWKMHFVGELENIEFRNLDHFKFYVSKLTQRDDTKCGVTYKDALKDLITEQCLFSKEEVELVRNQVRFNLLKRGLITKEVYDRYKYNVDGLIVDIGELNTGNPECVLTPAHSYVNYFYELYISVSYPYHVSNETILKNAIKLLATIEELERQHIYIKVTLVFIDRRPSDKDSTLLVTIPLFSHKQVKTVETMSAVVNDRLLRKFLFALLEDVYAEKLNSGYGTAVGLPTAITLNNVDEISLFTEIAKCKSR